MQTLQKHKNQQQNRSGKLACMQAFQIYKVMAGHNSTEICFTVQKPALRNRSEQERNVRKKIPTSSLKIRIQKKASQDINK